MRERLETDDTTRLLVSAADSIGSITAQRRVSGGWSAGYVELHVETGELVASIDATGELAIEKLGLWLGPIDIPPTVLGHGAQLTDVHVSLAKPVRVPVSWTGDDDGRAAAELDLTLEWSLRIDGNSLSLGAPDLPPVPVDLVLGGTGSRVLADLRASSPGVVWSWADLVKLENLELILSAATVTP